MIELSQKLNQTSGRKQQSRSIDTEDLILVNEVYEVTDILLGRYSPV